MLVVWVGRGLCTRGGNCSWLAGRGLVHSCTVVAFVAVLAFHAFRSVRGASTNRCSCADAGVPGFLISTKLLIYVGHSVEKDLCSVCLQLTHAFLSLSVHWCVQCSFAQCAHLGAAKQIVMAWPHCWQRWHCCCDVHT